MERRGAAPPAIAHGWEAPANINEDVGNFIKHVLSCRETKEDPEMTIHLEFAWAVYEELFPALKNRMDAGELPDTPEKASKFIIETLQKITIDNKIKEFLKCYNFPLPSTTTFEVSFASVAVEDPLMFTLNTFPVKRSSVGDGDGFTVWAKVNDFAQVDTTILTLMLNHHNYLKNNQRRLACNVASELEREGYRVLKPNGLAKKFKIRLRGIDAPELRQAYGDVATTELANLIGGRCLTIHVYNIDKHKRYVADVYCDGSLVQKTLLEKGCAWYCPHFGLRDEFDMCQVEAKKNKVGLWALPNPESPWEWKKRNA